MNQQESRSYSKVHSIELSECRENLVDTILYILLQNLSIDLSRCNVLVSEHSLYFLDGDAISKHKRSKRVATDMTGYFVSNIQCILDEVQIIIQLLIADYW